MLKLITAHAPINSPNVVQATRIRGGTNGHSNQFSQMLSREVAPIRCAGESSKQPGEESVAVPSPALKWQAVPPPRHVLATSQSSRVGGGRHGMGRSPCVH